MPRDLALLTPAAVQSVEKVLAGNELIVYGLRRGDPDAHLRSLVEPHMLADPDLPHVKVFATSRTSPEPDYAFLQPADLSKMNDSRILDKWIPLLTTETIGVDWAASPGQDRVRTLTFNSPLKALLEVLEENGLRVVSSAEWQERSDKKYRSSVIIDHRDLDTLEEVCLRTSIGHIEPCPSTDRISIPRRHHLRPFKPFDLVIMSCLNVGGATALKMALDGPLREKYGVKYLGAIEDRTGNILQLTFRDSEPALALLEDRKEMSRLAASLDESENSWSRVSPPRLLYKENGRGLFYSWTTGTPGQGPSAEDMKDVRANQEKLTRMVLEQSAKHAQEIADMGAAVAQLAHTQTQTLAIIERNHTESMNHNRMTNNAVLGLAQAGNLTQDFTDLRDRINRVEHRLESPTLSENERIRLEKDLEAMGKESARIGADRSQLSAMIIASLSQGLAPPPGLAHAPRATIDAAPEASGSQVPQASGSRDVVVDEDEVMKELDAGDTDSSDEEMQTAPVVPDTARAKDKGKRKAGVVKKKGGRKQQ